MCRTPHCTTSRATRSTCCCKIKTIQNDCQYIWLARGQSRLSSVPRPSIIVANVHEFLCVGSSALGHVRGSVPRRVHQIVNNMASIQKIFTTPQSPNRNLHEDELCGLTEQVDWTESCWRSCPLIDQEIPQELPAKVHVFSDSVLCLGGKWKPPSTIRRNVGDPKKC